MKTKILKLSCECVGKKFCPHITLGDIGDGQVEIVMKDHKRKFLGAVVVTAALLEDLLEQIIK